MALILLLSLSSGFALEESLLQVRRAATPPPSNALSGIGAKRYGTWGSQKFKWDTKSKVAKYFMVENVGKNATTEAKATGNMNETGDWKSLVTKDSREGVNKTLATGARTETVKGLLQKKADYKKGDQISTDRTVEFGHDSSNTMTKDTTDIDAKSDLNIVEDNQGVTDTEVESPTLISDRDGFVTSNWTSSDKYTTWAAIGILERMIDRATGDPYTQEATKVPPPDGMGYSGHPGLVGKFGTKKSPLGKVGY